MNGVNKKKELTSEFLFLIVYFVTFRPFTT